MHWLECILLHLLRRRALKQAQQKYVHGGKDEKRRLYLVVVVMTVEEGLLPEDHARQHATQAPHIQTVVVHLKHTTSVSGRVNRFWLTIILDSKQT